MFPDRTGLIQVHKEDAQRHRRAGNHREARPAYMRWVESLRQQNVNTGGQLERELEEAKREYSEFVKTDPLYHRVRDAAAAKIREQPGILQTELYKALPEFAKGDISYAMWFAADHGAVVRTKKGRTYSLTLP